MKSILIIAALTLAAPAFADNTQTINALGQIAGALSTQNSTSANSNMGQVGQIAGAFGLGANTNASLTTQPVLYSDAALKGMDCLGLEIAKNKITNAVNRTKSNATDLLAAEKEKQGQTKSNASAAADIAALVIAQRGGRNAEYAKMYQSIQGDSSANSNALDVEIKNLENMNSQLSEIQIYQKYKSCPGTTPAYAPAPVVPVASTSTVKQTTVVSQKVTQATPPVLYSDAALKGMDCLGLELAKNKINNAVRRTKGSALDADIKNLENMNDQLSVIQIYQKYKSCPSTAQTSLPAVPVTSTTTVKQTAVTQDATPAKKVTKKVVKKKKHKKTT